MKRVILYDYNGEQYVGDDGYRACVAEDLYRLRKAEGVHTEYKEPKMDVL